jgi:branched-chain amino acid aminotransferase
LQDAFFDIVKGGNDPHDWLTFVDVPESEEEAVTA